ncbi:lysM domain-containing GPI-anchored protein 2 isoform X2 [Euphorbia lathyris]|uniref:lysM domain-containing GPI-anchored protein 2 isoform X2 n=1 Tax=Euphorbia lathyris TaxID=212925 RepID=UPI003313EEC5
MKMKMKMKMMMFVICACVLAGKSSGLLGFKCSQRSSCQSLVGYKTPNATSIFHLMNLFHLSDSNSILAANNLPSSTPSNYTIQPLDIVNIPIPCRCSNGSGVSDGVPIYRVQKDDGLFWIANYVYMGLVTYQQIQEANGIQDPNLILVGDRLSIPLPCSCDSDHIVSAQRVIHYAHIVEDGTTVESIAHNFGTPTDVLYNLNGISNNSQLIAQTVFDVPLKACNSWVSSTSADYPLLVPNGTYVFTANSCVKCKCNAANNWTLECEPSGLPPAANSSWSTCPSMLCDQTTLSLSNTTTTSGCNTSTCSYSGFSNQTIMTTLSTCPASDNYGTTISLSWKYMLIALHLVMLIVYPL